VPARLWAIPWIPAFARMSVKTLPFVTPVKTGVHVHIVWYTFLWILACAGMTGERANAIRPYDYRFILTRAVGLLPMRAKATPLGNEGKSF
jgi:hypothetical protein